MSKRKEPSFAKRKISRLRMAYFRQRKTKIRTRIVAFSYLTGKKLDVHEETLSTDSMTLILNSTCVKGGQFNSSEQK